MVLWDTATGKLRFPPIPHFGDVTSLAFSPDGSIIASGSDKDAIYLWDSQTRKVIYTFVGHASDVTDIIVKPIIIFTFWFLRELQTHREYKRRNELRDYKRR